MQTFNQIALKNAIGKTIKKVHATYKFLCIVYTDNSFSCFKEYDDWGIISRNDETLTYEDFIARINIRADGSTYFTNFQEFLIEAGILDGEQLIKDAKNRIDNVVKYNNEQKLKQYLKLKAEYESNI
jgi:hypothetical protein